MSRWEETTPQGREILRALAANGGPMTRYALAKKVGCAKGDISKLVERLVERGFAREVPRPEQRGNYAPLVALTDKGTALAAEPEPERKVGWRALAAARAAERAKATPAPKPPAARPTPKPLPPERPAPVLARPTLRREIGSPEVATPAPAIPPALATLRGIRHPEPVRPHAKPERMSDATWSAITNVKNPARSAA